MEIVWHFLSQIVYFLECQAKCIFEINFNDRNVYKMLNNNNQFRAQIYEIVMKH